MSDCFNYNDNWVDNGFYKFLGLKLVDMNCLLLFLEYGDKDSVKEFLFPRVGVLRVLIDNF